MEETFRSPQLAPQMPQMLLIPSAINSAKIAPRAKMLYAILLEYTLHRQEPPTQQELATKLGTTPRTVRSHLVALQKLNLVTVTHRGAKRPNTYGVRGI